MESVITSDLKIVNIDDVANLVIKYLKAMGKVASPLKLQKLLYYIQAWHLVYFEKHPLFQDAPQAWANGPVYVPVYIRFDHTKRHNDIAIESESNDLEIDLDKAFKILDVNKEQIDLIDSVLKAYGKYSHDKLILLTHCESPWSEARRGLSPFEASHNEISHESMYNFYSARLKHEQS